MKQLTNFQKKCIDQLKSVIGDNFYKEEVLDGDDLDGGTEKYVHFSLKDVDIWIYSDEAQFTSKNNKVKKIFEKYDYDDSNLLLDDFILNFKKSFIANLHNG